MGADLTPRGRGRPSLGTVITVRVPADVLAELDRQAVLLEVSRAEVIRRILVAWRDAGT